jgi:uncharacterized protein YqhQ
MKPLLKKGVSTSKGIRFYSEKDKKMMAFSTLSDGKISTEWVKEGSDEYNKLRYYKYPKSLLLILAFLVLCIICSYYVFVNQLVFKHNTNVMRISLIVLIFSSLLRFFLAQNFLRNKTETLKFHSAEHMAVNALNHLGRIPTMEELKKHSRYHNYCGVNTHTSSIFLHIFVLIFSFISFIPINWISYLIIAIVLSLISNTGIFNFMQYWATDTPEDIHLQTALAALNVWAEHELTENNKTLAKQETANTVDSD